MAKIKINDPELIEREVESAEELLEEIKALSEFVETLELSEGHWLRRKLGELKAMVEEEIEKKGESK
jgi:hypothetical protein